MSTPPPGGEAPGAPVEPPGAAATGGNPGGGFVPPPPGGVPPGQLPPSPPPPPPGGGASGIHAGRPPNASNERTWPMVCHLSALLGLLVPWVGGAVGPLVVWLVKRHDHPAIDAHGKESLNFQISILIYATVLSLLAVATMVILIGFLFMALALVVWVLGMIFAVVAAVKASNGEFYRYPFTIRFLV